MAIEFIGRSRELATLASEYESKRSNLIPIYGRRRIGKSELILHFLIISTILCGNWNGSAT